MKYRNQFIEGIIEKKLLAYDGIFDIKNPSVCVAIRHMAYDIRRALMRRRLIRSENKPHDR